MKTYTIYHGIKPNGIPKIGCDVNYPNRPQQQNLSDYYILETHTNIYIASNREIELQKQYKYEVDRTPYCELMNRSRNGGLTQGPKNLQSGQWKNAQTLGNLKGASNGGKKGGAVVGKRNRDLTIEQANEIRQKYKTGNYYHKSLAQEYNCHIGTIGQIIRGESYIN